MAIDIRRFDPGKTVPWQEGTILVSPVLSVSMTPPFMHQYCYLENSSSVMTGHARSADEIIIVLSGTGLVICGGKNKAVSAGETVAVPAGIWHTMLRTEKDEAPLLWASFWWEKLPNSFAGEKNKIYTKKFEKTKAKSAHKNTILADDVVPSVLKTPFGHAYGYLENGGEMELHSHPTVEFYLVYSGKGFVKIGNEECAVKPGDVIEIPPGEMHTMKAGDNASFLWAAFWWEPVQSK